MPRSLEDRRRAVAAALRAVANEKPAVAAVDTDARADVEILAAQVNELLVRLSAVETALLESAWERPAAPAPSVDEEPSNERVIVPAVPLTEGRMSSVAARALFGH